MSIIYSTDPRFIRKHYKNYRNYERPYFVTAATKFGKFSGTLTIDCRLADKVGLNTACIVGYDTENNRLIIVPTAVGNISVHSCKYYSTKKISIGRFLKYFCLKDIGGRYSAGVGDDGQSIWVDFDSRLQKPGEMRSK